MSRGYAFPISHSANDIIHLTPEDFYENNYLSSLGEYFETDMLSKDILQNIGLPILEETEDYFSISISQNWKETYFASRLNMLKNLIQNMSIANFLRRNIADKLCTLINNDTDNIVYYQETAYTFDDFVRICQTDTTYYISKHILLIH